MTLYTYLCTHSFHTSNIIYLKFPKLTVLFLDFNNTTLCGLQFQNTTQMSASFGSLSGLPHSPMEGYVHVYNSGYPALTWPNVFRWVMGAG